MIPEHGAIYFFATQAIATGKGLPVSERVAPTLLCSSCCVLTVIYTKCSPVPRRPQPGDCQAEASLREEKVAAHRRQRLPRPPRHQRRLGRLLQGGLQLRPRGHAGHRLPRPPQPLRGEPRERWTGWRRRGWEGRRRRGRAGEACARGATGANHLEEQRDVRFYSRDWGLLGLSGGCIGILAHALEKRDMV